MKKAILIDADTLIFVAAYHNRDNEHSEDMLNGVDSMITEALLNTNADFYCGFMKGKESSHRHKMFADYKANRPPAPEWLTKWKPVIEEYLANKWSFEYVNGIEVDDAIASAHYLIEERGDQFVDNLENLIIPVICSVDKDFNQIPGLHYNPKSKIMTDVSAVDALIFLHTQLLTGDSTDNIKGVPGIGPAKAKKILTGPDGSTVDPNQLALDVLKSYQEFHNQHFTLSLLDFAENIVKIVLKIDKYFKFTANAVPEGIKQIQNKEIPL